MTSEAASDVVAALRAQCPDLTLVTDPTTLESHGQDWTRFRRPAPSAVVFPTTVQQVTELVAVAAARRIPLVPSGGRTGLSGGAVAAHGEVVVSFDRMRSVLNFNSVDRNLTVEAGISTAAVQQFAREHGLYYPVSFASEGSSQIGGNIATNAGGIRVLRYGLTRDRVAALKVVTGRGEIIDCNRGLIKNATGYDLRHLFVGSEGTLGLIVEATLRLTDPPAPSKVLLLGIDRIDALMRVFEALRGKLSLTAFEFFTDRALHHVRMGHGLPEPMDEACPLYVVTEFDCPGQAEEDRALASFEYCLQQGWLRDGVISQSESQAAGLWRYREGISGSISHFPPYKNDLSVAVSRVPEFLERMDALMQDLCPDFEVVWYGHIGDGNLHLNILKPADMDLDIFEQRCHLVSEESYRLTQQLGGSISAEHGIGSLKKAWLDRVRSAEDIAMMRGIKRVFDPEGIFNPGKLL
jgi:FAD/FMN-containing dehydrogenase